MNKNWEDLQKKMQEDTKLDKQDVPDSLQPEKIEAMLNHINKGDKEEKVPREKQWKWKSAYTGVAAAACICLIIGGIFGGRFLIQNVVRLADNGLSDQNYASTSNSETLDADSPEEGLTAASNYKEIYKYLKKQYNNNRTDGEIAMYSADGAMNGSTTASESADGASKATTEESGSSAYSDTNVREEGVGEADTVKTDGDFIYTLRDGMYISIVDIREEDMSVAATINMSNDGQVSEFYIKDHKLYVCYTGEAEPGDGDDEAQKKYQYGNYITNTYVKTFDISDPTQPKEQATISQSGDYYTMRVSGDYIYLISQLYIYEMDGSEENPILYVPSVQGEVLTADRIYMPEIEYGKQYTVISSINMNEPDKVKDSKALLSVSGMCYVSTDSIYMCEQVYSDTEDYNQTAIRKINYKDGNLTAVAQTKVWGVLKDSFSIDEYDGNLRMVTTVTPQTRYNYGINPIMTLRDFVDDQIGNIESDAEPDTDDSYNEDTNKDIQDDEEKKETNALYILDSGLKQLSKIEGLAKDESIYSARFMGDTAYFVTYRQMDPLFSVDLSDPTNPEILGELKIPGFSEYLHPYSDHLLLGIGMDVDEEGITTNGMKLSMFDITDPSSVSEINKQVLQSVYGSDVFYNYKAVMIDTDGSRIGFSAYGDRQHYYVYSYDDNSGFTCLLDREMSDNWYGAARGLYAGNRFYIIEGNAIESFDLTSFDKIDDLVL